MIIGRPPRTILAIVTDKGERIDLDRFRGISKFSPQSIRLARLASYVEQLKREWLVYELGMDPNFVIPMLDAMKEIKSEEKRTNFREWTNAAREDQAKEGKITERLLKDAEKRLRAAGTPERSIRTKAAQEAGITRARADQILGPAKKTKVHR